MGRVRGHATAFGYVPDALVETYTVAEPMDHEGPAQLAASTPASCDPMSSTSAPFLSIHAEVDTQRGAATLPGASAGAGMPISTSDLKESMTRILLLFSNAATGQVIPHAELRAKVIGSEVLYSRQRQQYQKCLLEVGLMALVETGHLVRHGYGSWALYTAKPELWSGSGSSAGSSSSSAAPDRQMLDKVLKVSRGMLAARLPVAGARRQRSPLSPSVCHPTKRRKGHTVATFV